MFRPIAQAMSWDCPPPAPSSTNQRTMSCDTTTYNQDLPHDDSHHHHHLHSSHPPGISSSSSEHDNHENGTWSSDFSNSEDECSQSVEVDGVILVRQIYNINKYIYNQMYLIPVMVYLYISFLLLSFFFNFYPFP